MGKCPAHSTSDTSTGNGLAHRQPLCPLHITVLLPAAALGCPEPLPSTIRQHDFQPIPTNFFALHDCSMWYIGYISSQLEVQSSVADLPMKTGTNLRARVARLMPPRSVSASTGSSMRNSSPTVSSASPTRSTSSARRDDTVAFISSGMGTCVKPWRLQRRCFASSHRHLPAHPLIHFTHHVCWSRSGSSQVCTAAYVLMYLTKTDASIVNSRKTTTGAAVQAECTMQLS